MYQGSKKYISIYVICSYLTYLAAWRLTLVYLRSFITFKHTCPSVIDAYIKKYWTSFFFYGEQSVCKFVLFFVRFSVAKNMEFPGWFYFMYMWNRFQDIHLKKDICKWIYSYGKMKSMSEDKIGRHTLVSI